MPRQPDGDPGDEGSYDPSQDGPEASFSRAEDEERTKLERLIDRFLSSLKPEDAHGHLFSYSEMKTWILMHKRISKKDRF